MANVSCSIPLQPGVVFRSAVCSGFLRVSRQVASTAAPTPVAPLVHGPRLFHHNGHCCNCCNACYGDVPNGHKVPSPNEIQGFGFLDLDQHKVTCQCPSTRSESFCLIPCYPKSATSKCRKQHMPTRIICTILYQFSAATSQPQVEALIQRSGATSRHHLALGVGTCNLEPGSTWWNPEHRVPKKIRSVSSTLPFGVAIMRKEKNSDSARSL